MGRISSSTTIIKVPAAKASGPANRDSADRE
jgi:hypothetical protein